MKKIAKKKSLKRIRREHHQKSPPEFTNEEINHLKATLKNQNYNTSAALKLIVQQLFSISGISRNKCQVKKFIKHNIQNKVEFQRDSPIESPQNESEPILVDITILDLSDDYSF